MGLELGLNRFVGEEAFEASGKEEAVFVIKRDEALIESCVVESVQADAVADIEAFRFMIAPRENVGGDGEFTNRQAGNGAAVVVVVENDVPEVVLTPPLFGKAGRFSFTAWRSGDSADASAGDDFGDFLVAGDEEGIEAFLAERDEFGGLLVEFLPERPVERARSFKAFDATQLEGRIERGEVAEFHRHRTGRAAYAFRKIDDDGLSLIKLPKAELVIEVEDDEELVSGPSFACGHG